MKTRITRNELADWIRDTGKDSLMLTISEPHAKAHHLTLELKHMEPIVSQIVGMANRYVYGKHKHFESLKGVVVSEGGKQNPHFHIIFQKPACKDFEDFKRKLTNIATMLCDENFRFDFSESFLPARYKKVLAQPCYSTFVKVSNAHENIGSYLSKSVAEYFLLTGREVSFEDTKINLFVDFYNGESAGYYPRTIIRNQKEQYAHE